MKGVAFHGIIKMLMVMHEKTFCQNYIKFMSNDYFQMHKTLQLLISLITLNTNIFMCIKVIKKTCTHIYTNTKVIENAQLIKASVQLNSSEFQALSNSVTLFHWHFKVYFSLA